MKQTELTQVPWKAHFQEVGVCNSVMDLQLEEMLQLEADQVGMLVEYHEEEDPKNCKCLLIN